MEDDSIFEGMVALIGFSLFFILMLGGFLLASTNPNSFIYIKFTPPEDFLIFVIILLLDFFLLLFYLNLGLKYRISMNLNRRQAELLLISDKMKIFCIFLVPIYFFLVYFYFKYIGTIITTNIFVLLLLETCLIGLIFYNSYLLKRDAV